MADKTIGELPEISYLDSGSLFVAEQNGEAVKVSGKQLTDFSNVETTAQVEQAKTSAQEAKDAKDAAEAAILKGPIIQNGTWWVYNQTTGAYQNTGINATGPKGDTGPTASVNGITPDASGDVNVTASDVKMPDGTTTVKEAFDDMVHAVSQLVNPNLLDNWYFVNPVNQRGNSAYNGNNNYSIDRWLLNYNSNIELVSGGIKFSGQWSLNQRMETLPRGTYTFSVLYDQKVGSDTIRAIIERNDDNALASSVSTKVSDLVSCTVESDEISSVAISFSGSTDNSARIIAAKLELGTQQTLAHQDANGNWVLNEIPDYGEQLRRCQRYQFIPDVAEHGTYQFIFNSSRANLMTGNIPFPVTMRTIPSLSIEGIRMRNNYDGTIVVLKSATVNGFMSKDCFGMFWNVTVSSGVLSDGDTYSFIDPIIFNANL